MVMTNEERKIKVNEKRRETKIKLLDYLGNKCVDCGLEYNGDNIYVFDFHHVNPEEKSFGFSSNLDLKWETLQEEADKCVILCKLCHAKLHYEERFKK